MLNYAVFFFVSALTAAVLGFSGDTQSAVGHSAVGIAKSLFLVFAALAAASFLVGLLRRA